MTAVDSGARLGVAAYAQDFSHVSGGEGSRTDFSSPKVRSGRAKAILLFSDIPGNKILKFARARRRRVFRDDSGANGNTFDAQGRLYSCESRTRRVTRMDKKGKIEVLAERWEGKRFNAPNDIVVRKDGQRLLHRSGLRQPGGHARAGFLRRVSHHSEGADERDRQARAGRTASRFRPTAAFFTSPIPTTATCWPTMWTTTARRRTSAC